MDIRTIGFIVLGISFFGFVVFVPLFGLWTERRYQKERRARKKEKRRRKKAAAAMTA